ncbi:ribosome biogenesis regulatory protein homolog [Ptychodera flava]|uniref:ribosome biogenesis regulatory protein homolog n=1 Tax=Ptychodera flava TaxID=63121 RepID=UPI00396A2609
MATDVVRIENVLESVEQAKKYKTIEVKKDVPLELDPGNLLAVDTNPLDIKKFRANKDEFLKSLARDNTQLLFNDVWQLPAEKVDEVIVAKLPDPKYRVPREKPIPKERPPTKWEKFAKLKGIQKKKKSRMVWSDEEKKYVPRWGYQSKNDLTKEWVLEVPNNADPYEDMFSKKKKEKKERVAKNELQRLRNIARTQYKNVPGVGITPTEKQSKENLSRAAHIAKHSTASIGKFEKSLPREKAPKNLGKKRKFEANFGNMKLEKDKQLSILEGISKKKPKLDVQKAVGQYIHDEESASAEANRKQTKKPKKRKGQNKALPKLVKKNKKVKIKGKKNRR